MFARISTFEGPPEQTAEGVRMARRQFLPAARLQEGFRGMYVMLDAEAGRSPSPCGRRERTWRYRRGRAREEL